MNLDPLPAGKCLLSYQITITSVKLDLIIPKFNLSSAQRNMRYFGVKVWGEILEDIKTLPTLNAFKDAIYVYTF